MRSAAAQQENGSTQPILDTSQDGFATSQKIIGADD